jgi:hypothetical protein
LAGRLRSMRLGYFRSSRTPTSFDTLISLKLRKYVC